MWRPWPSFSAAVPDVTDAQAGRARRTRSQPWRGCVSVVRRALLPAMLCVLTPAAGVLAQEPPVEGSGVSTRPAADLQADLVQPPDGESDAVGGAVVFRLVEAPPVTVDIARQFVVGIVGRLPDGAALLSVDAVGNPFVQVLDQVQLPASTTGAPSRWDVTLVVHRVGTFEIDGLRATWITADGQRGQATTEGTSFEIRSTLRNESHPQPAPSGPAMQVMVPDRRPLWIGAVALGVLLGALGMLLWRRSQPAPAPPPPPPPRPPHELALERLDALAATDWLPTGQTLAWHLALSEILREYVGARFEFHAVESTTREVREQLDARRDQVGDHAAAIVHLLEEMDLVKFARAPVTVEESLAQWDAVRQRILELVPRVAESPGPVPGPPSALEADVLDLDGRDRRPR